MPSKTIDKLKATKERQEQRLKQLNARIKAAEAKASTRERKRDTRRKVLLGALMMEWMARDDAFRSKVEKALDAFLTRKIDRDLFGLKT